MVPVADVDLRQAVEEFLAHPFSPQRGPASGPVGAVRSLAPDFEQFREQLQLFQRLYRSFKVALFRDEDDQVASLPVLIAADLTNVEASEGTILDSLRRSGIPVQSVSDDEAKEVFVERISEFLQVQSNAKPKRAKPAASRATIVNSNRAGDTVLYCKGYFVSSATAFGTSTPASNTISAGRYSFGIVGAGGNQVFDGVLWTCPTTIRLNMP